MMHGVRSPLRDFVRRWARERGHRLTTIVGISRASVFAIDGDHNYVCFTAHNRRLATVQWYYDMVALSPQQYRGFCKAIHKHEILHG